MTAPGNRILIKWMIIAVLTTLVTWLAFRGYLSPDFLVNLSMYC